jgi:hypothetical protein
LTSSYADKDTDTPAYKETSAKMEILKKEGVPPFYGVSRKYIIFTRPFPINPDTDLRLRVSVTESEDGDFEKRRR